MKKKTLLLSAIFALLSLSSWAATVNYSMSSMGLANGAVTGTTVRSTSDANITFSFAQNSSGTAPAYYTTGTAVRLYQHATKGGSIKIYVASGYKITGVTITKASGDGDGPAGYLVDGGTESGAFGDGTTSNVISNINATNYVEFYCKGATSTTRCYVSAISVTYVATTPNPTKAADPIFSVPAGNYLTIQTVQISSTDAGDIYYTTDNFTTKTLYSTPISISANTIIKAFVEKTGITNSDTVSVIYTFPVNVSTIAALRAQTPDATTIYRITGEAVLTFKTSGLNSRNQKYIQDATGAVVIDDNGAKITTNYNIGDGIDSIAGTLTLFNSLLEFIPVADPGAATSTSNTVTPEVITIAQLNTGNYDAHLVKINNVTITGSGNFAQSSEYVINDGSTNGTLRVQYANPDYIGTAVPLTVKNITGVVYNNITGPVAKFVPRSLTDFETPSLCSTPTNITKTDITDASTQINWDRVSGTPDGYEYTVTSSAIPPASGTFTTDTFVSVASLVFNSKYYIHLRTNCAGAVFSNWVTDSVQTAMPVKLVRFEANATNNDVVLIWITAQEINNSHFEIQYSVDGETYNKIGQVAGKGNHGSIANYSFVDENVSSAQNYYRLKQVDFDGVFTYSSVVYVNINKPNIVSVYPNPVQNTFTVTSEKNITSVEVLDMLGNIQQVPFTAQNTKASVNATDLKTGVYILRITCGTNISYERINK
jgi:hypothetical protein